MGQCRVCGSEWPARYGDVCICCSVKQRHAARQKALAVERERTTGEVVTSGQYCALHNLIFNRRISPCCPRCDEETRECTRAGIRQSEPPPIYTISARDVVPGMIQPVGGAAWTATTIGGLRKYWQSRPAGLTGIVQVRLPGPSPRELCCTCWRDGLPFEDEWVLASGNEHEIAKLRAREIHENTTAHAEDCPVAPVDGVHGGMRLWPAGSWRIDRKGVAYISPDIDVYFEWLRDWDAKMDDRTERYRPPRDLVLEAFFYPPALPGAKPTAPGWDPYPGALLDLAVRWG